MKTGLVLEGGAMRGLFTAGVLDVFMEDGIKFDMGVGVSAGAVFGCNYKSQQIGRSIRYNKNFCQDKRYGSFVSYIKTGDIYDEQFAYHEIPLVLDPFDSATFSANPMQFYVVCTNAKNGLPVYHLCKEGKEEDIEWMRASASMPMVSKIVSIGGMELSDGGTADSIPIRFMQKKGAEKNVVILTQPLDFVKGKNRLLPLLKVALRKHPALYHALENRHIRYNETLDYIKKEEAAGNIYVIRPPHALNVRANESNPDELERVYQIGRAEGMRILDEVKAYLEESM